jgi:hypothetical protein
VDFSQALDIPGVPIGEVPEHNYEDEQTRPRYKPVESRVALHHLLMMQAIQRCIETPRGRLMIFAPPGSAKSTYASVLAPAWAMGRRPNTQIILASYATSIAAKQSRKVRSIMRDPQYSSIWSEKPVLTEDQKAVDDWSLTNGSSMMAAGLLAGITGNRADGVIIDDPVANREQTRWHEEDLAGAILPADYSGESGLIECRDGQTWEVLCIPAESERADDVLNRPVGEFLWPEWFPREHWTTWRDNPRAARTWAALYQQRPAPFTGVHFNRDMFKMYDPDLARVDV